MREFHAVAGVLLKFSGWFHRNGTKVPVVSSVGHLNCLRGRAFNPCNVKSIDFFVPIMFYSGMELLFKIIRTDGPVTTS
jgi:hypothetical protein